MFFIEKYETVTSTNDIIREKAMMGAPEGTVVIADAQTAGRGRLGREFVSPHGSGLYMSVLLRPKSNEDNALLLTAIAAVAAAKAIEKHSKRPAGIKWVNDIYQNGKKVCGILAEGLADTVSGGLRYVCLGIGINLTEPENGFPQSLSDIAGAVFGKSESFDRDSIAEDFLNELFCKNESLFDEYSKRSILTGKDITVFQGAEPHYTARVIGIERDFGLRVRTEDGREIVLRNGEVSVRF